MSVEPSPPNVPETLFVLLSNASNDDAFDVIEALHLLDSEPHLASYRDRSGRRWTPLHVACDRSAPRAVISSLLRAHPLAASVADEEGNRPLHIAAWRLGGSGPAALRDLIEAYPPATTSVDCYGNTPLHLACISGSGAEVVRALLSGGEGGAADDDGNGDGGADDGGHDDNRAAAMQNYRGNTPLHDALTSGSAGPAVVSALLSARPDVVAVRNYAGNTPLHCAVDAGSSPQVMRALLRAGRRRRRGAMTGARGRRAGETSGCPRSAPTSWRNADGHTPLGLLCHDYDKFLTHAIFCLDERGHDVGRVMTYHLLRVFEVAADMIRWSADGVLMAGREYEEEYDDDGGGGENFADSAVGSGEGGHELSEERKREEAAALVHATMRVSDDVPPELQMLIYRAHRAELGTPERKGGNLPLHVACAALPGRRRRRRPGDGDNGGRAAGLAVGTAATRPPATLPSPVTFPLPRHAPGTYVCGGGGQCSSESRLAPPSYDPARDVLSLHPSAARETNATGHLPLRIAVDVGRTWDEGVRGLVRAYPVGVLALNLDASAMPLALARIAGDEPCRAVGGTFEVLREMPELVRCALARQATS